MTRKARISAESLPELRDFLAGADVDMGCRPVAVKRGDRFATTVISSDEELDRLSARRSSSVRIELLEESRATGVAASAGPVGKPLRGAAGRFRAGSG